MKKITLILISAFFLFNLSNANAQCDLPLNEDGEYEVQEVVKLDATYSDSEIYGAAMFALAEVFNSAEDIIDVENEKLGYIHGQFSTKSEPFSMGMWNSYFTFSIRFEFKDSRYRITVRYMHHKAIRPESECSCPNKLSEIKCGSYCLTKGKWNDQKCEANKQVLGAIEEIKTLISKNLTVGDNW